MNMFKQNTTGNVELDDVHAHSAPQYSECQLQPPPVIGVSIQVLDPPYVNL